MLGLPYKVWPAYINMSADASSKLTYDKKLDSLGDLNFDLDKLYKLRSIKCFLDESAAANQFKYNNSVS